jgi:20S proteasome subunit beta 7
LKYFKYLSHGYNELIVGSYGSTLRYKSVERLKPIGKHSLLGASGEISDFQEIMRYLDELM